MGKSAETSGNADRLAEFREKVRRPDTVVIIQNDPSTEEEIKELRKNQKLTIKIPGLAWLAAFIMWTLIAIVMYLVSALLGSAAAHTPDKTIPPYEEEEYFFLAGTFCSGDACAVNVLQTVFPSRIVCEEASSLIGDMIVEEMAKEAPDVPYSFTLYCLSEEELMDL